MNFVSTIDDRYHSIQWLKMVQNGKIILLKILTLITVGCIDHHVFLLEFCC